LTTTLLRPPTDSLLFLRTATGTVAQRMSSDPRGTIDMLVRNPQLVVVYICTLLAVASDMLGMFYESLKRDPSGVWLPVATVIALGVVLYWAPWSISVPLLLYLADCLADLYIKWSVLDFIGRFAEIEWDVLAITRPRGGPPLVLWSTDTLAHFTPLLLVLIAYRQRAAVAKLLRRVSQLLTPHWVSRLTNLALNPVKFTIGPRLYRRARLGALIALAAGAAITARGTLGGLEASARAMLMGFPPASTPPAGGSPVRVCVFDAMVPPSPHLYSAFNASGYAFKAPLYPRGKDDEPITSVNYVFFEHPGPAGQDVKGLAPHALLLIADVYTTASEGYAHTEAGLEAGVAWCVQNKADVIVFPQSYSLLWTVLAGRRTATPAALKKKVGAMERCDVTEASCVYQSCLFVNWSSGVAS
jgi:hypothetical protein